MYIRIDSRDLSPYVRTQPGEGLDPANSEHREPQFTEAPALGDGAQFTTDAVGNRVLAIPLFLNAATTAALHQLIRDIESELTRGAQVEYALANTDDITWFDLEAGRLEVDYSYWVARTASVRAVLRLWAQPRGTTGTARMAASLGGTGAPGALLQFPVTGILGDTDAAAKLEVRVGSKVASGGRVVGYGVHPSASYSAIHGPSAPELVAQAGATVRGGSGAVGSQFVAVPVSPTGASGVAMTHYLTPPGGHVGRHRVFAIARSRLDRPLTVWARDRFGAPCGPTTAASAIGGEKWGLIDLGEVQVPSRDARQESVPTQYVEIIAGGSSGAAINASPAFEVNRVITLPLDVAPGIMLTPGAGGQSLLYADSFARLTGMNYLTGYPTADSGGVAWSAISGAFAAYGAPFNQGAKIMPAPPAMAGISQPSANATGYMALASGALNADIVAELTTGLTFGSSGALDSSVVEFWPKAVGPSAGIMMRLQLGPSANHHVALLASGNSLIASAGLGGSTASGFALGQGHRLVGVFNGGRADVYVATGALPASPILTASNAALAAPGWPQIAMRAGSNVASAVIYADDLSYSSLAGGASDITGREWFRFESHPEPRAIQGNASVFIADRAGDLRGAHPEVPAVGSPGPSGPAQMVVFSGDPTDFLGNDLMDVRLDVVERFTFLR